MSKDGADISKYLYAIIPCPTRREFKARGVGERGDVVYTINHRGMAAVVSDSPLAEYDGTRRNLMAHTVVLEEIMEEFDLLPVRFGTVATGADAIERRLLMPRYEEFQHLLEQMHGRVELGLKAFWYKGAAFDEVVRENEAIRKLRDSLQGRSVNESYYDRIRLGEAVAAALTMKRAREEELILSRIRPFVHKTKTNKILNDRMVVSAAFLVNDENEAKVDEAVKGLDAEFADRLMFKYVGPVPPYNFVNIVVNW